MEMTKEHLDISSVAGPCFDGPAHLPRKKTVKFILPEDFQTDLQPYVVAQPQAPRIARGLIQIGYHHEGN